MIKTKEEAESIQKDRGKDATSDQRDAANPQKSIWVEASAGTGKTKVLSDRVFRLLLDGVLPERILCLTYTKAGAVEMKDRISKRLSEWAIADDKKLEENLQKLFGEQFPQGSNLTKLKEKSRKLFALLLDTPGGLKIQTIHSFCGEILKRFPFEAGVSPYFEVIEGNSVTEALEQIKKEILNNLQANKDNSIRKALVYLTQNIKEKNFSEILSTIIENRTKIFNLLKKHSEFQQFENRLAKHLQVNPTDTSADIIHNFMKKIDREQIQRFINTLSKGLKTAQNNAETLQELLINDFQDKDYELYAGVFLTGKGKIRDKLADSDCVAVDSTIIEDMYNEALRITATNNHLLRQRLFYSTQAMFVIANELNDRYTEYKHAHSFLDYEDEIIHTRDLLADENMVSWVLYKLDGGIDHILVDEAQDTSPEQWDVIKSLSAEFFAGKGSSEKPRTIFVVGDRKQSIFSFQGANPEKLDDMYKHFNDVGKNSFKKVDLNISFRSSAAILDTVNKLFENPEVAQGVTRKDEKVEQIPCRAGEFGRVEIWPLIYNENEDKGKKSTSTLPEMPTTMPKETSPKTILAQKMADEIERLMEESKNTDKPLHFSDFMILVRRRNSIVKEFIRVCKERNLNIGGADRLNLYKEIAVQDLISLGSFLLLPNDDLSLAEVLTSPLFNLNDNDLLTLCAKRGGAPLWSRLGDFPQYAEIYKELQTLLNKIDYIRPFELYNYVLTNMNGRYKFTKRMGVEVEDLLDEFMNQIICFEQQNTPSLQGFISWFNARKNIEIKREAEQKDVDAIRIMTVHGSKGLQAPIVFLPDTTSVKNFKCEQKLLFDDKLGYYPLCSDDYDDSCRHSNDELARKDFEENKRLLYVALTRAEDRLYICGYGKKEAPQKSWYSMCLESFAEISQEQNKTLVYEVPEFLPKKQKKKKTFSISRITPENWVNTEIAEESALAKPYTPSKADNEEEKDSASPLLDGGNFYRRGTLIHKLLQFLPQTSENREVLIKEYLNKNASDFSDEQREEISHEICKLFEKPEFEIIFGKNSKAEVPIIGKLNDKIISAQIDRLVLLPEKIMIIDFKTNRNAAKTFAEIPEQYITQLAVYKDLIQKIYPLHTIETYILWTNDTRLMRVS